MSKVSSDIVKRAGTSYRILHHGSYHTKIRYLGGIMVRLNPVCGRVGR